MDIREYLQKEQKGFYKIITENLTKERRKQLYDAINDWHKSELKLLGIGGVVGSTLIKVENAYIEDADTVERGDIYDVTGRVSKCWITENDFDKVKCTNS